MHCKTCRFFEIDEKIDQWTDEWSGYCHRYPPTFRIDFIFAPDEAEQFKTVEYYEFPETDTEEWCGEYQSKDVTKLIED